MVKSKERLGPNSMPKQICINSLGSISTIPIYDIKKLTVDDKPPAVLLPALHAIATDSPNRVTSGSKGKILAFVKGEHVYVFLPPNVENNSHIVVMVHKRDLGTQRVFVWRFLHVTPFIRDPEFITLKCQAHAKGYTSYDEDRSEFLGVRVSEDHLIWVERGTFDEVPFERDEFEDKVVKLKDIETRKREVMEKYEKEKEMERMEKEMARQKELDEYYSKKRSFNKRSGTDEDEADDSNDDFGVKMDDIGSSLLEETEKSKKKKKKKKEKK